MSAEAKSKPREPLRDVAAGFDPDSAGSVDPDPTQGRFAPGQCLFRRRETKRQPDV